MKEGFKHGWPSVGLVAKPLVPPMHDGTKVLVAALVAGGAAERFVYVGEAAADDMGHHVLAAWRRAQRVQALSVALRGIDLLHAWFAPNPSSSRVLQWLGRLRPGLPIVQTVTAGHTVAASSRHLRGLAAVVCTSAATAGQLRDLGHRRVRTIYPGIMQGPAPGSEKTLATPDVRQRTILYAGDLDPVTADRLIVVARALRPGRALEGWSLHILARPKGQNDITARVRLRTALADLLAGGVVEIHGRVPDLHERMRRASVMLFCAPHCARKVDIPLVLLEALQHRTPVAVVQGPPAAELLEIAKQERLGVGASVRGPDQFVTWLARQTPEALMDAGAAGSKLVQRRFSHQAMAGAYAELYGELLH